MSVEQPGRRSWLWKDSLHGCELMDVVGGVTLFRLKKTSVRNCGGWIRLMREIDVVLFCSGIGDVIAPKDPDADTCRYWLSVPTGQDYLCVTIDCLQRLSERAGSSPACEALAPGCFWHSPIPLFSPCDCCGHKSCNPLQQVVEAKTWCLPGKRKVQPPCNIFHKGAVIFGKSTEALSLHTAIQLQVVDSAISVEPSLVNNLHSVYRIQEQPRLHRY